jgi:hypothetical protein
MKSQRELADGIKSLFQTVARTIGAARFIERELAPAVHRNVSRAMDRLEEMADETEQSLSRQLHQGKTENDQRRVRGR